MSEHSYSRRKLLAGLTTATVGGIAFAQYQGSASAQLNVEQSYTLEDKTTEVTGELQDVRLVVTANINYSADEEVTQLITKLEAAESGAEFVELDLSAIQQSTKENSTEITLRGSLSNVIDIQRLVDNTVNLESRLTVLLESRNGEIAKKELVDSGSLTIEDGKVQTDLGIQATGSYEISQQQ
jgi:outer membrane lipoprotein-sorting protein